MNLGVDGIYVISLDRLKVRKQHILELEKQLDCKFNLVEGFDNINYLENPEFIDKHLDNTFFDPSGYFTLGILCCALSHRKAWDKFIESDNELGLFLEDDIVTTKYLNQYNFKQIREELSTLKWGVCWYGKYHDDINWDKLLTSNIASITPHHSSQYAGHAYILNKESAKWFYNKTNKISYAVDVQLEISPFNQVSLTNSIFTQKQMEYWRSGIEIDSEFFNSNTVGDGEFNTDTNEFIVPYPNFLNKKPKKLSIGDKIIKGWEFTRK